MVGILALFGSICLALLLLLDRPDKGRSMPAEFDAFVSHSSADAAVANRIVEGLEGRGVRCWVAPRDVRPGVDFQEEIVTALEAARCLILLFSAKANASTHVHREVLLADNAKTPVYPVRVENVQPTGAMKYQLANRQWMDYFEDRARVIEALAGRIAHRRSVLPQNLGAPTPAAAAPQLSPAPALAVDSKVIGSDDGLRRWLPPALDPAFLLFQFKGRIGRRSFLAGNGLAVFLPILLTFLLAASLAPVVRSQMASWIGLIGAGLIGFVGSYCYLAVVSKRLHDFDLSAWWSVLQLGPVIAAMISISLITETRLGNESVSEKLSGLVAMLSVIVTTGSYVWLLFWPGKSTSNKYGPAPSFSRSWRPFDALALRASARSELDVPFVILSTEGRIGPKGLTLGLIFLMWLASALWFFKVVYTGRLAPFYLERANDAFWSSIGLIGIAATALFAFTVFSCVVAKRLHDMGLSAWLQILFSVGLVMAVALFGDRYDATRGYVIAMIWVGLVFAALFVAPGAKDFNAYGPPPGFRVEALREKNA